MREILIEPLAEDSIVALCEFVESKNTTGSGVRFYEKLLTFIESYGPLTNLKFPLCHDKEFAARSWSCIVFQNKWVIAFTYSDSQIIIQRMVLGSKLK